MNLVFVTEARFHRGSDGLIYSQNGSYGLSLWERYLSVFDKITVVARVEQTQNEFPKEYLAQSENISFIELPYFVGPVQYLKRIRSLQAVIRNSITKESVAYILRVPGKIGTLYGRELKKRNIPYAVEVVGDPWDVFAPGSVKHILSPLFRVTGYLNLKKVVSNAAAALYVTKIQLQKRYPVSKEAFTTNASNVFISDSAFKEEVKKFDKNKNDKIEMIAIGSLAQMYKAPDVVLKALSKLKQNGVNFHLTWLGDGIYKEQMIRLSEELNVQDCVSFLGNIPTGEPVREALKRSDLFIHVSRTEGLPRAMVEAMSVGLPCIGSKVGGIPELLEEKALIPSDNVDVLVNKIHEFLGSKELMNTQGIRNYNEAKEYSNEILMKRRREFCNEIINRL
ncbi:glycosyltransferase [Marinifilum sp. D714]|uniref:glycosyltransferase n=1 Tax=Marinifilum sp. D714 TaxID=2937523 RepID=UPI0027C68EAB|nr:glycosyltransferase [Marinifilum sp. D714]MDQ2178547.1 glycosyltransferase [Marinifilum sp. D714]